MISRFVRFEAKQLLPPFVILHTFTLLLAALARFNLFTLGDVPLLLISLYSTTLLLIYRYWQSMRGSEAAFIFSLPMPTGKLVFSWIIIMLSFCAVSAIVILSALAIQGGDMGLLLRSLPWYLLMGVFLFFITTMFFLLIPLFTSVTITHAERFRKRRLLWTVVVWAGIQALLMLLGKLTASKIPYYIHIGTDQFDITSTLANSPNVLSVSINTSMWMLLGMIPCGWLTYWVIRYQFQVLES